MEKETHVKEFEKYLEVLTTVIKEISQLRVLYETSDKDLNSLVKLVRDGNGQKPLMLRVGELSSDLKEAKERHGNFSDSIEKQVTELRGQLLKEDQRLNSEIVDLRRTVRGFIISVVLLLLTMLGGFFTIYMKI